MATHTINLKNLAELKIKSLQQQFQSEPPFGLEITVLSQEREIYRKKVDENSFIKNSNCLWLLNQNPKIINLGNHAIDYSEESGEYYIKILFNKIMFFLTTGYMKFQDKFLMDIIYILIILNQSKIDYLKKLIAPVNKRYYNKLWDVLLLIYNGFPKFQDLAKGLIDVNSEFLIDQHNQKNINSKFLEFSSLNVAGKFLKDLTTVITFDGQQEVNTKHFTLIDTLYRYFIYGKKLSPQLYLSKNVISLMGDKVGADVLLKIKDVQIQQLINIVKQKENDFQTQKFKIQSQKQRLKSQIEELEKSMVYLPKQHEKLAEQIKEYERFSSMPGMNLSPSNKILHHPEIKNCSNSKYVTLECGHDNCIGCAYNDISRFEDLFKNGKKIEDYHIRCLLNKVQGNLCKVQWDSAHFKTLGEMLNQFM